MTKNVFEMNAFGDPCKGCPRWDGIFCHLDCDGAPGIQCPFNGANTGSVNSSKRRAKFDMDAFEKGYVEAKKHRKLSELFEKCDKGKNNC